MVGIIDLMQFTPTAAAAGGKLAKHPLQDDANVNKYKQAATIVNDTMLTLTATGNMILVAGVSVYSVCKKADAMLQQQIDAIYNNNASKDLSFEKGIAFPTCLSINHIVDNYSPLNESESLVLADGDVVKIEMGIHIDGYIATSAHTVIIACSPNNVPTTGPKADVICAAFYACQVASRLVKPGNNSTHVRNAINRIASTFHCQPCDQTASYSVERYIIDGDQCIPNTPIGQQQLDGNTATTTELIAPEHCYNNNEEFEFLPNSVYTINAVMTTSPTGATRDSPIHTAGLAQRDANRNYPLKLTSSRQALSRAYSKFSVFPFSLRGVTDSCDDQDNSSATQKLRAGFHECFRSGVWAPLPVRESIPASTSIVAHFKCTIVILPNGTPMVITATGADALHMPYVQSEYALDAEMNEILRAGVRGVKKNDVKLVTMKMNSAGGQDILMEE